MLREDLEFYYAVPLELVIKVFKLNFHPFLEPNRAVLNHDNPL